MVSCQRRRGKKGQTPTLTFEDCFENKPLLLWKRFSQLSSIETKLLFWKVSLILSLILNMQMSRNAIMSELKAAVGYFTGYFTTNLSRTSFWIKGIHLHPLGILNFLCFVPFNVVAPATSAARSSEDADILWINSLRWRQTAQESKPSTEDTKPELMKGENGDTGGRGRGTQEEKTQKHDSNLAQRRRQAVLHCFSWQDALKF